MYEINAYINSLNQGKLTPTETATVTVLEKIGDNLYTVDYNGIRCYAIYNWFVCAYFVDDIYGRLEG